MIPTFFQLHSQPQTKPTVTADHTSTHHCTTLLYNALQYIKQCIRIKGSYKCNIQTTLPVRSQINPPRSTGSCTHQRPAGKPHSIQPQVSNSRVFQPLRCHHIHNLSLHPPPHRPTPPQLCYARRIFVIFVCKSRLQHMFTLSNGTLFISNPLL